MIYVDVILPLALPQTLTYAVPVHYELVVAVGMRVSVQLGQKKIYSGIICNIHNNPPANYQTKDIIAVLDESPIINSFQLKFWKWISEYYMCSLGEVMKAALPAGLKMESETKVSAARLPDFPENLTEQELLILQTLKDNELTIGELSQNTGRKNVLPIIKILLDKGFINIREDLRSSYSTKTETFIRLHPNIDSEDKLNASYAALKRAAKQQAIVDAYLHAAYPLSYKTPFEISKKELLVQSNSTASALKACEDKGVLQIFSKQINRISSDTEAIKDISILNDAQQCAYNSICQQFATHNTVLLHGVTSSGKTEIYIKLIDEQLKQGKQVLYLLPEIALTTQIIQRLQNVFGSKVGVYHSHFSDKERVEIYNNLLKSGNEQGFVILGARSAVFLPYTNLGLIIVDEEHENTYKQYSPAPRYHARDTAIVLAQLHGAKTLLGSATPAVETYYNAVNGKYGLTELLQRYGNMELPTVNAIDMVRARKRKEVHIHFSKILLDSIEKALEQGEQVILFQNRRGFSPFVLCQTCGYTPRCEYCDVSLTYHKHNNQLVCHYCGYTVGMSHHCPSCNSADMQPCGFGTEKVEEELQLLLPDARIGRLDLDSTRQKNAYQRILHDFEEHEIDILVGTQMVTKGLDFDNVSLVGILNADNMLNFPDFRSYERSFQLMAQVGGRAGRKHKQGAVLIQASDVKNPVINYVKMHDYQAMYQSQIDERHEFFYPPFCRLIVLTLKHSDKTTVHEAAATLNHALKAIFGKYLAGPEEPLVNRIQNKYLLNFRLKLSKDKSSQQAKSLLRECFNQLIQSRKEFRSLQISVDVDPM